MADPATTTTWTKERKEKAMAAYDSPTYDPNWRDNVSEEFKERMSIDESFLFATVELIDSMIVLIEGRAPAGYLSVAEVLRSYCRMASEIVNGKTSGVAIARKISYGMYGYYRNSNGLDSDPVGGVMLDLVDPNCETLAPFRAYLLSVMYKRRRILARYLKAMLSGDDVTHGTEFYYNMEVDVADEPLMKALKCIINEQYRWNSKHR